MQAGQLVIFTVSSMISMTSTEPTGAIGDVTMQWHHSLTKGFTPSVETAIPGADGPVISHDSQDALALNYYRVVWTDSAGNTVTSDEFVVGGALAQYSQLVGTYNTLASADELADEMPNLTAWAAATDAAKGDALKLARFRVDRAHRYQGRRYLANQRVEFPRIAYDDGSAVRQDYQSALSTSAPSTIWDWDEVNEIAVVPLDVKLAELFEANSILAADRDRIADAIANGLKSQSTGSLSETYDRLPRSSSGAPLLCRDAEMLMQRYRAASGRLL